MLLTFPKSIGVIMQVHCPYPSESVPPGMIDEGRARSIPRTQAIETTRISKSVKDVQLRHSGVSVDSNHPLS